MLLVFLFASGRFYDLAEALVGLNGNSNPTLKTLEMRCCHQCRDFLTAILEADAKEALEVVYAIFQLDLATSGPLRDEDHNEEDQ